MSHLIKIYPPVLNVSADHEELVQTEESHFGSGDKIEDFKEIFRDSDLVTSASSLLTHCILVDSPTVICWTSPFVILGVSETRGQTVLI